MSKDIFRHDAIAKLSSPKQLSKLLVVVRLRSWVVLFSLCAILIGIVIWSFAGQVPIIVTGQGILLSPESQFVVKSPQNAVVSKVYIKMDQFVPAGTPIIELSSGNVIAAPHNGKVFQIDAGEGEPVKVGSELFWFQTEVVPKNLLVYGFIPSQVGERIQKGMHVTFNLNSIDTNKFGQLKGVVKEVAPYPVSASSSQLKVIPSEKAREDLTKGTSMELVIIQPELDDKNPSGLKWTFGKGPEDRLNPGGSGTVRVTIENKKPISYLIPLFS